MRTERLGQLFYARPACVVARDLLGKRLVRLVNGRMLSGIIVETEAYCDGEALDLACHGDRANGGRPTPRTAVMFGPPGFAYVYFTYGMHWMFSVVTGPEGQANAVLIRALEPVDGVEMMAANRNIAAARNRSGHLRRALTNGPAKLTQALAINKSLNGRNLFAPDGVVWVETASTETTAAISTGPRIGLGKTPEPWLSIPWRYWLRDNPFISK